MVDALNIRDLTKVYRKQVEALKGLSFTIKEGDFFALLGPNGAGKSTTIGIIASLINKTSGQVKVFQYDLDTQKEAVKQCLGLVPQEFNFNIFEKVLDILVQQAGYYGIPLAEARRRSEKYLSILDLWDKRHEIARNLSGGMKRRLMIARAMVHEPKLLILDEPTAGVDVEVRHSIWAFLRHINAQGTTIILTTHYLEEVEELCRNVAIIDQGKILADTSLKKLLKKMDSQTFVLDLEGELHELPENNAITYKLLDTATLEVSLPRQWTLNMLFHELSRHNIVVSSMRAKGNRLESLFLHLLKQGKKHA